MTREISGVQIVEILQHKKRNKLPNEDCAHDLDVKKVHFMAIKQLVHNEQTLVVFTSAV